MEEGMVTISQSAVQSEGRAASVTLSELNVQTLVFDSNALKRLQTLAVQRRGGGGD